MAHKEKTVKSSLLAKNAKSKRNKINGLLFIYHFVKIFKRETLLIMLVALIFTAVNFSASIIFFYFLSWVSATFINNINDNLVAFIIYSCFFIVGYIIAMVLSLLENNMITKTAQNIGHQMRRDTFRKVALLKVVFFDTNLSGDILSRMSNDANNMIRVLTQNTAEILVQTLMFLSVIVAMFIFSPIISAIIVLGIFPLTIFYIFMLAKISQKYFQRRQKRLGALNGYLEDMITNIRTVKNFAYETSSKVKFQKKLNDHARDDYKATAISRFLFPIGLFLNDLANSFAIALPILFVYYKIEFGGINSTLVLVNGIPTYAIALITVYTMFLRFYNQGLFAFTNLTTNFQSALAGAGRIYQIHQEEEEKRSQEIYKIDKLKGDISIVNLTFKYPKSDMAVLKKVNLEVKAGEVIAIVGHTGSGKTTLINILSKFYEDYEGEIYLDQMPLKKIDRFSLRHQVANVLQDVVLFNDTILENIRFGDLKATDEEVYEAAQKANAHHFIMQLENGYKHLLSSKSSQLSVGQRQLISIARAFLKRSSILVLDEATSNIDSKTELQIQDAMLKLMKNRTTFIIAHRLSTIRNASKIAVFHQGQLIEMGSHNSLMCQKGTYYRLYLQGSQSFDD